MEVNHCYIKNVSIFKNPNFLIMKQSLSGQEKYFADLYAFFFFFLFFHSACLLSFFLYVISSFWAAKFARGLRPYCQQFTIIGSSRCLSTHYLTRNIAITNSVWRSVLIRPKSLDHEWTFVLLHDNKPNALVCAFAHPVCVCWQQGLVVLTMKM